MSYSPGQDVVVRRTAICASGGNSGKLRFFGLYQRNSSMHLLFGQRLQRRRQSLFFRSAYRGLRQYRLTVPRHAETAIYGTMTGHWTVLSSRHRRTCSNPDFSHKLEVKFLILRKVLQLHIEAYCIQTIIFPVRHRFFFFFRVIFRRLSTMAGGSWSPSFQA